MTLYEELGVPPDAPLDTIREAYRNVARLLHPDAQTNPVLKESAEVQMRRINHLYEVLSDPDRRRRYDQELAGFEDRQEPLIIHAPPRHASFEGGNKGTLVWLAATAICAGFIIWLATRGSSAPAVYSPSPLQKAATAVLPQANSDRPRGDEISRLRAELAAANTDRQRLMGQIAAMDAGRKFQAPLSEPRRPALPAPQNLANLTPAPLAPTTPREIALPGFSATLPVPAHTEPPVQASKPASNEATRMSWTGKWTYHPPQRETARTAIFPPEFIETVIHEENGRIRGQYHARFKVSGAKISPNVDFRFEGMVAGKSGDFPWTGPGGARGEVQLHLISDSALEVIWSASSLGRSMGLASGTAVLNRKD